MSHFTENTLGLLEAIGRIGATV
ncbi:MAG: hypothetical protein RL684_734, partial [Pseudomonadota bacterium]